MTSRIMLFLVVAMGLLMASAPAFAHHGRVGYDNEKVLTLKATITGFEWSNPHIQIHFDAPDEKGAMQHWTVEGSNPFSHQRTGWTKDEFKPGDHVTITFHPAKNGYAVGYLMNAITASGKKVGLAEGATAPQ